MCRKIFSQILVTIEKSNSKFDFVAMDSKLFQLHLKRIAQYLSPGENVWWHHKVETNEIVFHDSKESSDQHANGPEILAQFYDNDFGGCKGKILTFKT